MDWTENWQTILTTSLMTSNILAELFCFMRAVWWDHSPEWCSLQAQSYLCCDWGLPWSCLWVQRLAHPQHSALVLIFFPCHPNIKFCCPCLWFKQNQLILARVWGLLGNVRFICLWCELLKKFKQQVNGGREEIPNQRKLCSSQVRFSEYIPQYLIWNEVIP